MYTPASDLFERVIDDLRTRYDEFGFHTERDVVWTIQKELVRRIRDSSVALRVVNDYPILPGNRRSLTADLAILDAKGAVEVAAEFKYEPAASPTSLRRCRSSAIHRPERRPRGPVMKRSSSSCGARLRGPRAL
jgi:hypothetical protein